MKKPSIELHVGRDGRAGEWTHYLPPDSRAIERFREPVTIVIKGPVIPGPHPETPDRAAKVFVAGAPRWQDAQTLIDTFAQLWPDTLQLIAEMSAGTVGLVYFAGPAAPGELLSLWSCMPDNGRFFIGEMCKDARGRNLPWGRVCIEYTSEDFKQVAGPDGFDCAYGTYVMGVSIPEFKVASYLRNDLFDKTTLDRSLEDEDLRCWWFCDSDFEGMTIWHKDFSGDELSSRLQEVIDKRGS